MRVYKMTYRYKHNPVTRPDNWALDFRDHLGRRQRISLRTANKRAAERIAEHIDSLIAGRMSGLALSPALIEWLEHTPGRLKYKLAKLGILESRQFVGSEPLAKHLAAWHQSMQQGGVTAKHADQQLDRVTTIVDGCGFKVWSDVKSDRIQGFMATLVSRRGKQKNVQVSNTTKNYFMKAFKQFCHWAVQHGRIDRSPLDYLKPLKARAQKRRSLELDEIARLLQVTIQEPKRYGLTGPERALLYRLAIETGLRGGELRALTVECFDFDSPSLCLSGKYTKNGQDAVLPLKYNTAQLLRDYLKTKSPQTPAFTVPDKTAAMIKDDFDAAMIDYADNGRGKLDFHSLRHTFGTLLAASGVHPKTAQELMRHSKIDLTMSIYTHTLQGQNRQAIEQLPELEMSENATKQKIA